MNIVIYPIIMALISLFCAGISDVIYKNLVQKVGGHGFYMMLCGLVWAVLQLLYLGANNISLSFDNVSIFYGILTGAFMTVATLLLFGSLKFINVSFGSTVYRLNTIGVVILSALFLNEQVELLRALGVVCGIIAITMLYLPHRKEALIQGNIHGITPFAVLQMIVIASILRGLYGIFSKAGLSAGADANVMLLLVSISWVFVGLGYGLVMKEDFHDKLKQRIIYAVASGILIAGTLISLIEGLKYGDASLVIPIANMSFVLALIISVWRGMEKFALSAAAAIGLGVLAIIMISQTA